MTEAVATKKPARKAAPKKAAEGAEMAPKASKSPVKAKGGLYGVFTTGGKQYRVQAGDRLKIEILPGEHKEGEILTFDQVLLTDNGASEISLGKPYINGSKVTATLVKIGRYPTVTVIKYKPKSRYFKKNGHRQPYFEIEITEVK